MHCLELPTNTAFLVEAYINFPMLFCLYYGIAASQNIDIGFKIASEDVFSAKGPLKK